MLRLSVALDALGNFGLCEANIESAFSLLSALTEDYVMSKRGQQPSKERWDASQISVLFSLTSSRIWGECGGNRRGAPKLPLCSPSSLSVLFSQRAKRENACAIIPALLHLS